MRKIISMMIALLCMVVQTAWAQFSGTSRYFDLNGRQIDTKPVHGVYIRDGKKFQPRSRIGWTYRRS